MMDYDTVAKNIIENKYGYVAIRSIDKDESYEIGDFCRESYEWDIENDCSSYLTTQELAGGTCGTIVNTWDLYYDEESIPELIENLKKAIKLNKAYGFNGQIIIAGDKRSDGCLDDENEVRIVDAKVIGIVG